MLTRAKIFFAMTTVGVLLCPHAAAQAKPVGMLLMVQGKVEISRGSETIAGNMADLIMSGDRLSVSGGSAELLFCPGENRVKLTDGSQIELTDSEVKSVGGPAPALESVGGCILPQVAIGAESLERVGGLRGRGSTPIPIYLGGKVASTRPTFEWEPIEGGVEFYVVTVRDQFGTDLWKSDPITSGTQIAYPQRDLDPNRYSWEVRGFKHGAQDIEIGQQSARFQVSPNPSLASGVGSDGASRLLRAVQLENAGYFSEAAALYRELREETGDARLTRRLALLYWQSGLITAANLEKQRLEHAGPGPR